MTRGSHTHPPTEQVRIEQAIAKHGTVDAAAVALAGDGVSWQRVKAVYDAMEEANK